MLSPPPCSPVARLACIQLQLETAIIAVRAEIHLILRAFSSIRETIKFIKTKAEKQKEKKLLAGEEESIMSKTFERLCFMPRRISLLFRFKLFGSIARRKYFQGNFEVLYLSMLRDGNNQPWMEQCCEEGN